MYVLFVYMYVYEVYVYFMKVVPSGYRYVCMYVCMNACKGVNLTIERFTQHLCTNEYENMYLSYGAMDSGPVKLSVS